MTRLIRPILILAFLLALAPSAMAASRNQIIKDCADDGQLEGHYSQSELRDARQHMPSDVAEYTDCADVLRRAELPDGGSSGGAGGSAGGGGAAAAAAAGAGGSKLLTASTDADREALKKAATTGGQPIKVNGENIVPGATGLHTSAGRSSIPGTLLAALILLGLAGGALTIPAVRNQLPFLGRNR